MASRPNKRARTRLSTSPEDSESNDDWTPSIPTTTRSGRESGAMRTSNRGAVAASATVEKSANLETADSPQRSIRLTVKAPPSRLREVTATTSQDEEQMNSSSRGSLARSSKNRRPIIDPSSDEEDELMGEPDDEVDELQMAEEEEDDEDEDAMPMSEDDRLDAAESPAPPRSLPQQQHVPIKPLPLIRLSAQGNKERKPSPSSRLREVQSVESREMEMDADSRAASADEDANDNTVLDEDDEELSDLEDADGEGEEEEEDEEDGEGDEDEDGEGDEDDDEQIPAGRLPGSAPSSSSSTPDTSRAGTPDLNKLTRRQRATYEAGNGLMALSNEATKKKFFTEEQITMRRAELARRRKDLSEKRNEEEKADTLKRLLEKPAAPKRRTRAQVVADAEREEFGLGPLDEEGDFNPPRPGCIRIVIRRDGSRIGVPDSWLEGPIGKTFAKDPVKLGASKPATGWRMVEIIE